jgi:hypothetical protein
VCVCVCVCVCARARVCVCVCVSLSVSVSVCATRLTTLVLTPASTLPIIPQFVFGMSVVVLPIVILDGAQHDSSAARRR